jgi:hypothetical protein
MSVLRYDNLHSHCGEKLKSYNLVHFILYTAEETTEDSGLLGNTPRIQFPLNIHPNQFLFASVVPKYLNCDTFSSDLFAILM